MEIKRYNAEMAGEWNDFVDISRQGTFLFKRGYMDYHSDRFQDYSLMAFEGGRLKAVLPANISGGEIYSHQGLTYGGWLTPVKGFGASDMLELFSLTGDFLMMDGINKLHYKPVPWIYSRCPAEEDIYAIFRHGGVWETCQISSVIDLERPLGFDSNSKRNLRKAVLLGLEVSESGDYKSFWKILSELLSKRYGVKPVHSVFEMEMLAGRFPENIRLYLVKDSGSRVLAGVVAYLARPTVHIQYIAASDEGKESGALPILFNYLIDKFANFRFFDFGTSCERGGEYLNAGLLRQKNGFGGRAVNYNSFCIDFAGEKRGENIW